MKTAFRFSRQKETIPVRWTYPQTGDYEGAQVWRRNYRFVQTLMNGGRAPGWNDGFDYNPSRGYRHVLIMDVTGYSGESGPLSWKAVTEEDIEAVWIISWKDAKRLLQEIEMEYRYDERVIDIIDELGFKDLHDWMGEREDIAEDIIDRLKEAATETEPRFADTLSPGLINS